MSRVFHTSIALCAVGLACLALGACTALRDEDGAASATGGYAQRAVIGGKDNVLPGVVITRYMDRQARALHGVVPALRSGDGIIVTLPQKDLFASDSGELRPRARESLKRIATVLCDFPHDRLTVIGHTDDRGFADFDIRLSERHAGAVADVLVDAGIPRGRVRIMGMGFARPLTANDSAAGRERNRRVEIHIAPDRQLRHADRKSPP